MLDLNKLKTWVRRASLLEKDRWFYHACPDETSVLDVGVSRETKEQPLQNHFLKNYRFNETTYVGLGVQNLTPVRKRYPAREFVEYLGGDFPFSDKQFGCVHSNSVIEHVGDEKAQLKFVNEMLRVGNTVFFTTSNKYFPVEAHTNVLFLHWNDSLFFWWRRKFWRKKNKYDPYLFSYWRLRKLLAASDAKRYVIKSFRKMGLPMVFVVVCTTDVMS